MIALACYLGIGFLLGLLNARCSPTPPRAWEWTICLVLWPLSVASLTLVLAVMTIDRVRFGPLTNRRL